MFWNELHKQFHIKNATSLSCAHGVKQDERETALEHAEDVDGKDEGDHNLGGGEFNKE